MDKPKEILDLEKELGFELTETKNEEDIFESRSKNTKLYLLSEKGRLIGLNLSDCDISEISFLYNLSSLNYLNLSYNRIMSLNIMYISYKITKVSPLSSLVNVTKLNLSNTQISDISLLSSLVKLTELNLSYNKVSDISPLSELVNLTNLDLDNNKISNISPLSSLVNLTKLNLSLTQISDISPLSNLVNLTEFNLSSPVSDISPLSNLLNLTELNLSSQTSDISPLSNLLNLTKLNLSSQTSDISPLKELVNLTELHLMYSPVSDISPLKELVNLTKLDLHNIQISDISPLKELINLTTLDLHDIQISDISPLKELINLTELNLRRNQVFDISPLKELINLTELNLERNQVSDISALKELINLTELNLMVNQVSDISSLKKLLNLTKLDLRYNKVSDINSIEKIISKNTNLWELSLNNNPLPIPLEIIRRSNVFELRNYIKDLKKGKVGNQEAKVIFIGNGSVGKTQIARRLVGFDYQLTHKSTHAISILRQKVACNFVENGLWVSYWDFGGQDIYHTTHRLFMQTRAVIVLVWDSENEKSLTHSHNDKIYDNHNLEYWLSYAHYFSPNSPILVVQNKIDEKGTTYLPSETKQKYYEEYPQIAGFLEVSAENKTNIDVLQEKIKHTFENNLNIRAEIIKPIPKSWNNVLKATRFIEKFGYKKISKSFFTRLCRLNNVKKSTNTILSYLHNIGALYHKEGYFSDKIILNQDWAIQAIYKILDRETQYFNLLHHAQENDKKISYSYLKEKVWTINSDKECELFLDFMQSAELCYEATPKDTPLKNKEYVIPQLLPLSPKEDLESYAKARNLIREDKINYRFLPPSLIQRFMVTIQNEVTIISLWQKGLIIKQENSIMIIESIISKDRALQYISLIYNEEAKNGFIEKIKDHFKILEGESPIKTTKSENGFDAIRYGREQMFGIQDRLENIENPQLNPTQMKNEKFITYLSESTGTEIPDLLFAIKKQYEEMPSSKRGTFNQLKDEFENPPNNFQLNGWKARLKVFISGLDFEIDFETNYPNQTQTTKMEHLILKQIKGLEETYSILIDKKTFFEKELRKTNDTSARFSLTENLKDIKTDMNNLLQEIDELSQQTSKSNSNSSSVSGNGNIVIQGSNNSQINIEINNLKEKAKQADTELEESLKEDKKTSVFISYNHKDKELANRIKDFLRKQEIDVTIDSEAMKSGEDIKTFIEKCVRENDVTLSLVSKNSLLSAWVAMESVLTFAGEKLANKKFIAVYEDDSFFDITFTDEALDVAEDRIKLISETIQNRLSKNRRIEDLQSDLSRYKELENNLPQIVGRLRNSLCIDISGNKFEAGMQKVCNDIKI
jgi:internalin A